MSYLEPAIKEKRNSLNYRKRLLHNPLFKSSTRRAHLTKLLTLFLKPVWMYDIQIRQNNQFKNKNGQHSSRKPRISNH